ncbi:N-formylglutamate amidohydrolase [Phenylobacterium montanum]|uniref:N-formylglutamate amidohydrolase n=1 Tax=Phenylobacterium montanum TaxID=2823693 RepID=A0A975FX09_9CAUL|nr:N-formylglutamate amidohydrolase [Caulobacter sp. S6]QUD86363.1 N-formylglutamate amidohydrolase [Caulobacter sp. S6]
MDAWSDSPAASALEAEPPFVVRRPAAGLAGPLVFASPHSGRLYPEGLMAASALDALAIRRSEDALVDQLILGGLEVGANLICARYARAYVDVNREPYELDPAMFEDELPDFARGRSPRVAAGLGSIARIVGEGQEIYDRKLTFAEAEARIETIHGPYHAALKALAEDAVGRHGAALLVDWHSMPAAAARPVGREGCDVVLGDRFGVACSGRVTDAAEAAFVGLGYRVSRNTPYAGGYTTEAYGRPSQGMHALQIELSRGLYLDEAQLEPHAGYDRLRGDLEAVFRALATVAGELAAG